MIPSKSKALLIASNHHQKDSLVMTWAGLGLAIAFLMFATLVAG